MALLSNNVRGLLKVLGTFLVLPAIVGLVGGVEYIWDQGYLWGPYWQRLGSVYDPKYKELRCLDENGELMKMGPPCLVWTARGYRAMERWQKDCQRNGGAEEACMREALDRLMEYQPGRHGTSSP